VDLYGDRPWSWSISCANRIGLYLVTNSKSTCRDQASELEREEGECPHLRLNYCPTQEPGDPPSQGGVNGKRSRTDAHTTDE
jgi:hypothetical protein